MSSEQAILSRVKQDYTPDPSPSPSDDEMTEFMRQQEQMGSGVLSRPPALPRCAVQRHQRNNSSEDEEDDEEDASAELFQGGGITLPRVNWNGAQNSTTTSLPRELGSMTVNAPSSSSGAIIGAEVVGSTSGQNIQEVRFNAEELNSLLSVVSYSPEQMRTLRPEMRAYMGKISKYLEKRIEEEQAIPEPPFTMDSAPPSTLGPLDISSIAPPSTTESIAPSTIGSVAPSVTGSALLSGIGQTYNGKPISYRDLKKFKKYLQLIWSSLPSTDCPSPSTVNTMNAIMEYLNKNIVEFEQDSSA